MKEKMPVNFLAAFAVVFIALNGGLYIGALGPVTGLGPWRLAVDVHILFALAVCFIGAIASGIAVLIATVRKRSKLPAAKWLMAFVLSAFLTMPSMFLALGIREFGFALAAKRAEPLVEALREYERDNKAIPPSIEQLVPQYLSKAPYGLPPLELRTIDDGGWILAAEVGTGMLNWDAFIYRSDENYGEYGPSGEKIGRWIYYHE